MMSESQTEKNSFGVPNGDVNGIERDYISDPDVVGNDPFDGGVENPDRVDDTEPPLNPASEVEPIFHVEEEEEEGEEEEEEGFRPVDDVDVVDDPSIMEELEMPDSFDDLDDSIVVTGEYFVEDGLGEYDFKEDKEEVLDYESVLQFDFDPLDSAFTRDDEDDEGGEDGSYMS